MATTFCLTKPLAKKFREKLKDGTITPAVLNSLKTSAERIKFFEKALGVSPEIAKKITAFAESKLILKNQKRGLINWAKQMSGIKEPARRDLITRILNTKDPSLEALTEQRLGFEVTEEEIKNLTRMAKTIEQQRAAIPADSPVRSTERVEYGTSLTVFKEYVKELKLSRPQGVKERLLDIVTHPVKSLIELSGAAKSMMSTLDNSFFGRQGIKMFYTNPKIWQRAFLKSWKDIGKELKGQDAILPIKADIFSRPNALNGTYQKMKLDIGIEGEEAFPSSLPEKIPGFKRVFKAAESAFNGAALRMRADYADKIINLAKSTGVELTDKKQLEGIGKLVNSMTGRGSLGRLGVFGKEINATFFSLKFLKSNFDTLSMHLLDPKASSFVKKQAAQNLLKIIGGIALISTIAELLNPGSVEKDPRSSHFGKIKIGENYFDLSGGNASLLTLATRTLPSFHNGKFGWWTKNTTTGKFTELNIPRYGARTALDVVEDFFQGKAAPMAGVTRDVLRGRNFDNEKPTLKNTAPNLFVPFSVQNFMQLKEAGNEDIISAMILEGLGFSIRPPYPKNWNHSTSKELLQFKEEVGQDKFNEANKKYNKEYSQRLEEMIKSDEYIKLTDDEKGKELTKLKDEAKDNVFKEYDFKYKKKK